MKISIGIGNQCKILVANQTFEKDFDKVKIEGISILLPVVEEPIHDEFDLGVKNCGVHLVKHAKLIN